jgi:hypothetical protein
MIRGIRVSQLLTAGRRTGWNIRCTRRQALRCEEEPHIWLGNVLRNVKLLTITTVNSIFQFKELETF